MNFVRRHLFVRTGSCLGEVKLALGDRFPSYVLGKLNVRY